MFEKRQNTAREQLSEFRVEIRGEGRAAVEGAQNGVIIGLKMTESLEIFCLELRVREYLRAVRVDEIAIALDKGFPGLRVARTTA